jgi:EAL domain-containing protein (putative c-di-GMP-specific phosphodiesterase class I)
MSREIAGIGILGLWADRGSKNATFPARAASGSLTGPWVGAWALRQAALDRSRWLELRLKAPRVAVNVSTIQLRRGDFVPTVADILKPAGSEAGLDIEVTESMIIENAEENIAKLAAIRDLGVHIALDHFGTGYSSLGGRIQEQPRAVSPPSVRSVVSTVSNSAVAADRCRECETATST